MKRRRKKILVTGAMGFIGSNFHLFLPSFEIIDLKLGKDIRACELTKKYDVIYHLAAFADTQKSIDNPLTSHSHNVEGTLRILEYARRTGCKVVFASSSSVYEPTNPYALQKKQCEEYLKLYWGYGVKSVALRLFNVFGEFQEIANGGYSLVLARFLQQKKEGKPLTITDTGEQRRDFVYVRDVIDAMIKAEKWLNGADTFETFDVGSGINISINEVANLIDPNGKRIHLPPRDEPFSTLADITKTKKLLKWSPKTTLQTWIKTQLIA